MLTVVAALITDHRNRVLLAKRSASKQCPGMWEYPGGKVGLVEHPNETPREALRRELLEELGDPDATVAPDCVYAAMVDGLPRMHFVLYPVTLSQAPRIMEDQQGLEYHELDYAVLKLPCCPTTYTSYGMVSAYLLRGA